MTTPSLSRFTPSLMPEDLLERLFVARTKTLDAIVQRIEAAATTSERNHTLLVGPRGAGKTHLISLAYHRTQRLRSEGAGLAVSWLPEDPWTIVTYRHLLAAILAKVEPAPSDAPPKDVALLEARIVEHSQAHGPIVVLLENLDVILDNLGDDGQQRLRHLLQDERPLLLVATTTRLDRTFSDEALPFYDFFTTTRLHPFDVEEAAAMLSRIAEERGDTALVEYLGSEVGRSRLRTIAHLAGGQPRMWAALASALTIDKLDDLVELLLTRFDDLTPYYQEQLSKLSGQQRLVVAELAEADRPLNVKDIAERLDLDQRSVGKTMTELTDRGWVAPTASTVAKRLDQRRTYYDLAEPLARLSFQIKESRGEPLRLIIDFLKLWFDPTELDRASLDSIAHDYVVVARSTVDGDPVFAIARQLRRLPASQVKTVELLGTADDALAALGHGDPEPLLRLPTPLRLALEEQLDSPDDVFQARRELHWLAQQEFGNVRHPAMDEWIRRCEDLVSVQTTPERTVLAQLELVDWLGRAWRFDSAQAAIEAAQASGAEVRRDLQTARANLANSYRSAGRTQEAIELEEAVLTDRERILGPDHPHTLTARANLANSYRSAGRTQEAIELEEAVLTDSERILGPDHPDTLTTRHNLATSYWSAGRTQEAIELEEAVLTDRERILGPDHPDTLTTRHNLANSYRSAGRTQEAIALHEDVLTDRERILGPDHPDTLATRHNLAYCYRSAGRTDDAIALEESVLTDSERLLGPDHPHTLGSWAALASWRAETAGSGG